MTADAAIRAERLTKTYGNDRGLVDLDLSVTRGEVMGFIGPNGAGKSTTIRLLLDLLRPTSGRVEVLGEDPRAGGAVLRSRIGYLAGDLVLPERMTGRQVIDLLVQLSRPSDRVVVRNRVGELAERLELDLSRPTRSLSKGNRQKIGLVQAFAHAPELLVLDEPTSGLDPLVQQTFHSLVKEAAAHGSTVFMSSHVISEIEQTADRIAVLREGRLVALARVDELRDRSVRRVELRLEHPAGAIERAGHAAGADEAAESSAWGVVRDLALVDGSVRALPSGGVLVAGAFTGDPPALIERLGTLARREHVRDLVVGAPDLEDALLRYYREDGQDQSGGTIAAGEDEVVA